MKVDQTEVLRIKLYGSDASKFKNILSQLCDSKIGFNKSCIDEDQMKLLKKINNKL